MRGFLVTLSRHGIIQEPLADMQATGGSAVISIGAGTVSDIAEPRERGKFMSIFQCGTQIGPAFGPLLGGVFSQTLGWRAIFWFLTIATGVVLVPLILSVHSIPFHHFSVADTAAVP